MHKKRIVSTVLLSVFIVISLLQLYLFSAVIPSYFEHSFISGKMSTTGSVTFRIASSVDFDIVSPTNRTYDNFTASDAVFNNGFYELPISLLIHNYSLISVWNYSLNSPEFGIYYDTINFIPNITLYTRIGGNNVTVIGGDGGSENSTKNVSFFVRVNASAPQLMFDNTTYLYACEHNNSFEYIFNITDLDNDTSPSLAIVPQNPFYVQSLGQLYSGVFYGRIYTLGFTLDQSDVGTYSETITVTDSDSSSDAEDVTIEVLDINKVPSIEDLGVRMIWNTGDNATFYYEWDANDVDEDGTLHDGIMNISLSYQNGSAFTLFTINATGVMNFTADNTTALATHNLMICVNDSALLSPHENLSTHCGTTGSANTICDTFSLTITDSNRAPVIRSSYPTNTSFSADADDTLTFRVYAYDADDNPIDYDWYVDGSFIERTSFNASANYTYSDDFTYAFPCGVTGIHTVSVNVTDGSAYDNVTWFVTVSSDSCDSSSGSSGGGGGDFTPFCSQQWLCPHWNTCVNALSYFTSGLLDIFVYNSYLDQCQQLGYNESTCGFQTRSCEDANTCTENIIETEKPGPEVQVCYFVENAGCSDNIKNCHSGSCEFGVDCGGPCNPCPTCSDGVQNQGELGVDCGGPCPLRCEVEEPSRINSAVVLLVLGILVLAMFIMYVLYRIFVLFFAKKRKKDTADKDSSSLRGSLRKRRIKRLVHEKRGGDL